MKAFGALIIARIMHKYRSNSFRSAVFPCRRGNKFTVHHLGGGWGKTSFTSPVKDQRDSGTSRVVRASGSV